MWNTNVSDLLIFIFRVLLSELNIVQHCMMSSLPREPPESLPQPAPTQSVENKNQNNKRKRSRSSSYEEPCDTFVKPQTSYLDSKGGFTNARLGTDSKPREIFIFPCTGNLSTQEKDELVKVFTARLFKLEKGGKSEKVINILSRIVNKDSLESWSKNLCKAVKILLP